MKTLKLALLAISIIALNACTNADQKNNTEHNEDQHTNEDMNHQHEDSSEVIVLNNGEKWKVDENMLVFIMGMRKDIEGFTGTKQEEYKLLADKLQINVDKLTSNCTMTGQAHDELHKWLLPYIDMVKALLDSENIEESEEHFEAIKNSFVEYDKYFN